MRFSIREMLWFVAAAAMLMGWLVDRSLTSRSNSELLAMLLYRFHFGATRSDPFPPIDTLPTIEAADSTPEVIVAALAKMISSGFVLSNREAQWARVIVSTHSNGELKTVVRVPISATGEHNQHKLN